MDFHGAGNQGTALIPRTREGSQNQICMSLMKGPLSSVTCFPLTILYIILHLLPLSGKGSCK